MSTHEEWEDAREKRDRTAVRVTRAIMAGNTPLAKDLAVFAAYEDEMDRIAAELDGNGGEAKK
ncbi:hypothetical protein GU243_06085 [Pseudarthrobacter psychrotolerans]|uniref:Uncharacterized protein n=1 Tax=Pseudarthrobacter psychrotolerans TaxID=2697569 RepID=A0A6P1NRJ1_9MICC|nr:hypothetical protein [Pseudarthrobacter psychrotolerans]QHK19381.1 hypothetical protein GU243_06085 [Pseudarthrobacter psychrotolerans]